MDLSLLTIKEAAAFLNVKVSWLRSRVFRREIPYSKLGRLIRFNREELTSWLNCQRVGGDHE